MMSWWHIYIIIVALSLSFSLALTPLFRKIAEKLDFYDKPASQAHKKHQGQTPLMGGVAIFLAWVFTVAGGVLAAKCLGRSHLANSVLANLPGINFVSWKLFFFCLAALLAVLLGLYDDRFNMRAITKLTGQIAVAVIAVTWGGVEITMFFSSPLFSWFVSVFWILLIMNAINFFDNMDGLAVGTASIALCLFTITAAVNQQYFVSAMGAAAAGASIGFWFYNHSPATIFMGDSGSHFLGYILAVVSASVTYYSPEISTTRFPILIPLFVLAIPLFDTAAVVVIRLLKRKPIYIGDHNHISHRFARMGMSRKTAVFVVHMLELIIGLSVLPLLWGDERTTVVSLLQACTILFFVSVFQYSSSKRQT
jgi:UDP-GlcNAc:undecaprenyl-phosphate GlcNAc-1-phosphate transferase